MLEVQFALSKELGLIVAIISILIGLISFYKIDEEDKDIRDVIVSFVVIIVILLTINYSYMQSYTLIPSVEGIELTHAQSMLHNVNLEFEISDSSVRYSDGYEYVNNQSIKAESIVKKHTTIILEVGPEIKNVNSDNLHEIDESELNSIDEESNQKVYSASESSKSIMENNEQENSIISSTNVLNGYHEEKYKNGIYKGNYKDDLRSGYGEYYWDDGDIYKGNWVDDEINGKGTYTWPDGDIYEGEFLDGLFNGYGELYWKNGNIYKGEWVNDNRTGSGTYYYTDKSYVVGTWKNNKMHGVMTFHQANGNTIQVKYINGVEQ